MQTVQPMTKPGVMRAGRGRRKKRAAAHEYQQHNKNQLAL
jgi:hypothetical protein